MRSFRLSPLGSSEKRGARTSRFLLLLLFFHGLGTVSYSKAPSSSSFQGVYAGPTAAYGFEHLRVDGSPFKAFYFRGGLAVGAGLIFQERGYLGLEGGFSYDGFSRKKGEARLSKTHDTEGLVRLGRVTETYFLPYVGLGCGQSSYRFRDTGFKKSFKINTLISEVGVDAFLQENTLIRSSVRYERGNGIKDAGSLSVNKKPSAVLIKIGVFLKV